MIVMTWSTNLDVRLSLLTWKKKISSISMDKNINMSNYFQYLETLWNLWLKISILSWKIVESVLKLIIVLSNELIFRKNARQWWIKVINIKWKPTTKCMRKTLKTATEKITLTMTIQMKKMTKSKILAVQTRLLRVNPKNIVFVTRMMKTVTLTGSVIIVNICRDWKITKKKKISIFTNALDFQILMNLKSFRYEIAIVNIVFVALWIF